VCIRSCEEYCLLGYLPWIRYKSLISFHPLLFISLPALLSLLFLLSISLHTLPSTSLSVFPPTSELLFILLYALSSVRLVWSSINLKTPLPLPRLLFIPLQLCHQFRSALLFPDATTTCHWSSLSHPSLLNWPPPQVFHSLLSPSIPLKLNLGCLHPVACVRSGDGDFYIRLRNVTIVG
jgi:hypothetical protein